MALGERSSDTGKPGPGRERAEETLPSSHPVSSASATHWLNPALLEAKRAKGALVQ